MTRSWFNRPDKKGIMETTAFRVTDFRLAERILALLLVTLSLSDAGGDTDADRDAGGDADASLALASDR